MKPILWLAAMLLATLTVAGQISDFQVMDSNGQARTFSSLKGDATVVVFLSTRCPVSNAYNRRMESLFKDYSAQGVKFIFVNANFNESATEVAGHAKDVGYSFPVYRDSGNVAALFNAQVTPETFVIDKQGMVRYHGAIDDSQNEARVRKHSLRAALDEVLAGKNVTIAETKAFGCTVKRAPRRSTELAGQLLPLDGDGYARMLQAHRGKVVLVDFWATWCDPCREELPKLVALSTKFDPKKLELITVSADEPEKESAAIAFLDKQGIRATRYIKRVDDDQLFIDSIDKKWSGALPALFLYNASGVRVASFIGESDLDEVERSVRAHTAR